MAVTEGGATYIGCALQKDQYTLIEQSSNSRITCCNIPYSAKLWRRKTLANLANDGPIAKFYPPILIACIMI